MGCLSHLNLTLTLYTRNGQKFLTHQFSFLDPQIFLALKLILPTTSLKPAFLTHQCLPTLSRTTKTWEIEEAVTGWSPSDDGDICAAQSGGTFVTDKQVLPGLSLLLVLSLSRFPVSASFTNSENCDGPFAKI